MRTQSLGTHPHDYLIGQMLYDPALRAYILQRTRPGKWGCIEWTGGRSHGYGKLVYEGKHMVAHRVTWILRNKTFVPYDYTIDHLCCNGSCVNPDHLEAIDAAENAYRRDKAPKGWVSVGNKKYPRRRKLKGTHANTPPNPLFPAA
jgi:hypothetical protein